MPITPVSISLVTRQSSSISSLPTAVVFSSMKTDMTSRFSKQSLSLQNPTTTIVSTQYADKGATEGFFDHPSNVASTVVAVSALGLASIILGVLASKLTAEGGLEGK